MTEKRLLGQLKRKRAEALERVVHDHGDNLLILAFTLVDDPDESFALVHDLLSSLWENGFDHATHPLHTYLYNELRLWADFWQSK